MPQRSLRLWPAAVAVGLILLMRLVALAAPDVAVLDLSTGIIAMLGSVLCAAAIVLWWLFFSRAPWSERLGGVGLIVLTIVVIWPLVDPSITGGLMSRMLPIVALPVLATALVVWATLSRRVATGARWGTMALAMAIGGMLLMVIRTDGITGDGAPQLRWRWTPTAEQRLLASAPASVPSTPRPVPTAPPPSVSVPAPDANPADTAPTKSPDPAVAPTATPTPSSTTSSSATPTLPMRVGDDVTARVEWPGFRGRNRDSVISGVHIDTDWTSRPPVELWRKPIGPGWSSFAVDGDLVYTQEQRGNDELVSCYRLSTGDVVWRHSDPVRFYESNGGAGPRATPSLHNGRVYAHGATGIVNALDAKTGTVLWSRNAASDSSVEVPGWGVTSSPLVVDDLVIVAVSGRLVAYDTANGALRWLGPAGGSAYSSPHLVEMDGVPQVLLPRGSRTISVAIKDGALLWEHSSGLPGVSIVQPAHIPDGDLLIAAGDAMGGTGMRRIAITHVDGGWSVAERWVSRGLKPYFNDFVVHKGHAYGFDGSILASIDLSDGNRSWKGGRYGSGQLMLLPDQDLLLVLSEEGELALVSATPDKFTEIGRAPAISGKTWNHPVLVGDVLLVRNGEEMAAFRLRETTR